MVCMSFARVVRAHIGVYIYETHMCKYVLLVHICHVWYIQSDLVLATTTAELQGDRGVFHPAHKHEYLCDIYV